MTHSVLLDTSFFIRLLNDEDPLHQNAKLFAQSNSDKSITHFVTSDSRSLNIHKMLSKRIKLRFEIIDIQIPYNQQFGILDLK